MRGIFPSGLERQLLRPALHRPDPQHLYRLRFDFATGGGSSSCADFPPNMRLRGSAISYSIRSQPFRRYRIATRIQSVLSRTS
jgi:hypothetical protein